MDGEDSGLDFCEGNLHSLGGGFQDSRVRLSAKDVNVIPNLDRAS